MLFRSQWVWASLPVLIAVLLTHPDTIIFLLALLLASCRSDGAGWPR
ncbi:hypothetical protein [Bradyrhizobium algeriense]|nr:hypothetical protein [Bradyrhizobium algeriense]